MTARWAALAVSFLLVPPAVFGQVGPPATFTPASPTNLDQIDARIVSFFGACDVETTTVVTNDVVRTTLGLSSCIPSEPIDVISHAIFGPLPAGSYTFEVYYDFTSDTDAPVLFSRQPLVVGAALPMVSTLTPTSALLLSLLLAALALLALRRFGS